MSRCLKNDMRSARKPASTPNNMGKSLGPAKVDSSSGGGSKNKQYNFKKGPGALNPNYPQPDQNAKYGKTGLK